MIKIYKFEQIPVSYTYISASNSVVIIAFTLLCWQSVVYTNTYYYKRVTEMENNKYEHNVVNTAVVISSTTLNK